MSLVRWEQRFRALVSFLPEWSPWAPERTVYASNESGIWQPHTWDLATGTRRQVTDHAVGVLDGTPTLDEEGVLWFQDETGDESGRWLVQSFHGGETREFLEGVPHGWSEGLAQAPGIVAAGITNREGFAVRTARRSCSRTGSKVEIAYTGTSSQPGTSSGWRMIRESSGKLGCARTGAHGSSTSKGTGNGWSLTKREPSFSLRRPLARRVARTSRGTSRIRTASGFTASP